MAIILWDHWESFQFQYTELPDNAIRVHTPARYSSYTFGLVSGDGHPKMTKPTTPMMPMIS